MHGQSSNSVISTTECTARRSLSLGFLYEHQQNRHCMQSMSHVKSFSPASLVMLGTQPVQACPPVTGWKHYSYICIDRHSLRNCIWSLCFNQPH